MLRWSRHTDHDGNLPHADALVEMAAAQAGDDDARLATARRLLLDAAGPEVVIDAAAVAANFEMMTRLADGTGAMQTDSNLAQLADLIDEMGLDRYESARRPDAEQ
jgi:hypothetical protein